MKLSIFLFLSVLSVSTCYAQSTTVDDEISKYLISLSYSKASEKSKSSTSKLIRTLVQVTANNGQNKTQDSLSVNSLNKLNTQPKDKALIHLIEGYYILYNENANFNAFHSFYDALKISEENQFDNYYKLGLIGIIELYTRQYSPNTNDHNLYINKYKSVASTDVDYAIIDFYTHRFNGLDVNWPASFDISILKLFPLASSEILSNTFKAKIHDEISVYYRYVNVDSAIVYARKIKKLPNTTYNRHLLYSANLELAGLYARKNMPDSARTYFNTSKKFYDKSNASQEQFMANQFKALHILKPLKEYDSAFFLLEKVYLDRARLGFKENKTNINALNAKLQTVEKENQILIEKEKKQRNRNIAIGLGGLLILGGAIAYLLQRNASKKQQIAEQQREIEIQKTEKILKEQELITIDAMLTGQEKERRKLADDLHDSVGATLAAAKLQFDHISKNREYIASLDELFTKTNTLLEDAYTEIRGMAHLKNSGVLAKNSLLPAVKKLAYNASSKDGLTVTVEDFGLEKRLENSLEILIFRIIQELITNIIKHANATEATIAITQHETDINIVIEDDGRGFDPALLKNDGMGLSSIERRVEHLEGTMEVDSTIGRGTSIFIEIPL